MSQPSEQLGHSNELYPPSKDFVSNAQLQGMDAYRALHKHSIEQPEQFWGDVAKELHWFKPWTKVLDESKKPFFEWYKDGKTNLAYNCLDRYLGTATANKAAIIFEGEPGDQKV